MYKLLYVRNIEMTELPFSMGKCIIESHEQKPEVSKFGLKIDHHNKDLRCR